jgi:Nif-specific regulatory protein
MLGGRRRSASSVLDGGTISARTVAVLWQSVRRPEPMEPSLEELDRLRRERDLYLRLLDLGGQQELEPFLAEALALVADSTGARRGYLELQGGEGAGDRYAMARGCSSEELETIRFVISRGIVAEALATGRTVATSSAALDPRFRERESVRAAAIDAVLCAPVGSDPPLGVVYLSGRSAGGPWSEEDHALVERFARHLAPLAHRLLAERARRDAADHTRDLRGRLRLDGVIGRSAAFASAVRQAALVAPLDVHVLLTGESGTGKSQLARVIHDNGPRARGPFVAVNCAALPEGLVESELYGAREGAHSTARRELVGKVAAAEGGTLFLDEISELPPAAQAKLLHLLQAREYYPLGAARPERADVRLIAASNVDLDAAVAEKRFREDLYFRLTVLPIRLPSLAERREDVPELAAFFCGQACERHRLPMLRLSPAALRAAESAPWPGNIRQLAHVVEAGAIRAAGEGVAEIEPRHLFPSAHPGADADAAPAAQAASFQDATRRFQRELLLRTLEATSWNVTETARQLDLARSHVYNLIRAFGLERDTADR